MAVLQRMDAGSNVELVMGLVVPKAELAAQACIYSSTFGFISLYL